MCFSVVCVWRYVVLDAVMDGGTRTVEPARGPINFTRWEMNSNILQFATVMMQNFCE
jgi:hypothetical protein